MHVTKLLPAANIYNVRESTQPQENSIDYGVVLHSHDTSSLGLDTSERYKICQKGTPGNENLVMILSAKHKRQLEYDKQKQQKTKQAGEEFVNTWSTVRSVEDLDTCPSGGAGQCEMSNIISTYYTNSPKQLASFKEACTSFSGNVWTENP